MTVNQMKQREKSALPNNSTTMNGPITPFDQLPIEAQYLLAILATSDCARLGYTKAPAQKRLMAMARTAWDPHQLSIEALRDNPEVVSDLLRNFFRKQTVQ
jgi:hypothetical protein